MMSSDEEKIIDENAKTWSAKFPGALATKMVDAVKDLGYLSISDLIREACRDKIMYNEVRAHKMILDYLVGSGKLDVLDVKEAIYVITKREI